MYRIGKVDIKSENIRAYSRQTATYDAEMHRELGRPELDADRVNRHVKWDKGGMVLEVGAGTGYAYQVCRKDASPGCWVSSDISQEMLKVARSGNPEIIAVVCDAENLPFPNGSFDYAVCSSLMHHLPEDVPLLLEMRRVLNRKGVFLSLHEPNMEGCDFWMRVRHVTEKYGDRKGLASLTSHLAKGGKMRDIVSYGLSEEELAALDRYEVRGSILHPTRLKKRGGINPHDLVSMCRAHFREAVVLRFGFLSEMLFIASLFTRKRAPFPAMWLAGKADVLLGAIFNRMPFADFSLICQR